MKSATFGGLIASGWLTLGSPGHEEMNWARPVRPGDRVQGRVEIKESRVSKSKPDLGFARYTTLSTQNGEQVFVMTSTELRSRADRWRAVARRGSPSGAFK